MKRVTLIRHGESAYNHFRKAALQTFNLRQLVKYDPGLVDAGLTETGRLQARRLAHDKAFSPSRFELILCSPLSRAIDTTLELFVLDQENQTTTNTCSPIIITPLLTEWLDTKSDIGLSLPALELKYNQFAKNIDWSVWEATSQWKHDAWWFNSGRLGKMASFYRIVAPEPRDAVRKRVDEFLAFLASRSESNVCVIGHSWFFQVLTGESKLSNCEAREYIFDPEVRQFQRVIP